MQKDKNNLFWFAVGGAIAILVIYFIQFLKL